MDIEPQGPDTPSLEDRDTVPTFFQPEHVTVDNDIIRSIATSYIIAYLKWNGLDEIADQLAAEGYGPINTNVHQKVVRIAQGQFEEQSQQFSDIINAHFTASISKEDARKLYHDIIAHLCSDQVNWGRIISLLQFSSELALHCTQNYLKTSISDVIEWTENELVPPVYQLVEKQGGWEEFFREENTWRIDLPTVAFSAGLVLAILAAGFFMARTFFK